MAKLYPPQLEGMLPAFYGNQLTIPFTMNDAVSASSVRQIAVRVKHAQSGNIIYTGTARFTYNPSSFVQEVSYTITETSVFTVGNFYKVQIAYVASSGNETGYYSSIGVIKYTATPEIFILNDDENGIIGKYVNGDFTEKVYYYTFNIYDSNNKLLKTTGQRIHNIDNDESGISYDILDINSFISSTSNIKIEYKIQTNNLIDLKVDTTIVPKSFNPFMDGEVSGSVDYVNAVTKIMIQNVSTDQKYRLIKSENFASDKIWETVAIFNLEQGKDKTIYDFNIVQGQDYNYTIIPEEGCNIINIPNTLLMLSSDFEDMFLYDGERQLRICYNPKVASFKHNSLETKTNTIGSKYPFIFRNEQVGYKEFSISGLISYLSDENGYFSQDYPKIDESFRVRTAAETSNSELSKRATNLTSENIAYEREFKQEVLNWLTNGKPKVFKSPAEGNYIVNLTGVSLSPNDTLGRMLHTFTCTAVETAEYNNENLIKYNFIKTEV